MLGDTLSTKASTTRTLVECGMFGLEHPDRAARALLPPSGVRAGLGCAASALRHPGELALVDDRGSLTFDDCTGARTRSPAPGATRASAPATGVTILCRNHRGLVDATIACSKLGADALFMNIAFAARSSPRSAREQPCAIVYDEELGAIVGGCARGRRRFVVWSGGAGDNVLRLDELAEPGDAGDIVAPDRAGRIVILTSGTTGPPRGAIRRRLESLGPSRRCCRGSHCACVSAR